MKFFWLLALSARFYLWTCVSLHSPTDGFFPNSATGNRTHVSSVAPLWGILTNDALPTAAPCSMKKLSWSVDSRCHLTLKTIFRSILLLVLPLMLTLFVCCKNAVFLKRHHSTPHIKFYGFFILSSYSEKNHLYHSQAKLKLYCFQIQLYFWVL